MICDLILEILVVSEMAFFGGIFNSLLFGWVFDGVDTSFEAVLRS